MLSSSFLNAQEKHGDAFSFFFLMQRRNMVMLSLLLLFNAKQNIQQNTHKQICN